MARAIALAVLLGACLSSAAPAHAQCLAAAGTSVVSICPTLAISRDDGRTFSDTGIEVRAAAVTSEGHVLFVAQEHPDVVVDLDASLRTTIPFDVDALAVLGRTFVVVGPDPSSDEIRTRVLLGRPGAPLEDLGTLPFGAGRPRLSITGTETAPRVEIVIDVGMSCVGTVRVTRVVIDARGVQIANLVDDELCANQGLRCSGLVDIQPGAHGSAYAIRAPLPDGTMRAGPLFFVRPEARATPTSLALGPEPSVTIAHNGRITLALVDGVLHRLEGTRVTRLGGRLESGARLVLVDDRGRAYAELGTSFLRFSRGAGWERLGL
ncbi:MAG: hypothetical protein K1X94_31910 [Sandaracinaceae bacterium]|nr:hypothetical protein [Sandaracinaceae bacterium]